MNLKKSSALALSLICLVQVPAFAQNAVQVTLNNNPIAFTAAQPTIVEGRTLVPLRGVFENMGFSITWDANTKIATLDNNEITITASTQKMTLTKNGVTSDIKSDVNPQLIQNSFMVPLRVISDTTGAQTSWNANTKTASISYSGSEENNSAPVAEDPVGKMSVDEKEYLQKVDDFTKAIKVFAQKNDDSLLLYLMGSNYIGDVKAGGDLNYYKPVFDSINELNALIVPENMKEVQGKVNEFAGIIKSSIEYAANNKDSNADLLLNLEEQAYKLVTVSQEFGAILYKYFGDNQVYFEGIYGESILDALKFS